MPKSCFRSGLTVATFLWCSLLLLASAAQAQSIARAPLRGNLSSLRPLLTSSYHTLGHHFAPLAQPVQAQLDLPLQGRAEIDLREARVTRGRAQFVTAHGILQDSRKVVLLKGRMRFARGSAEVPVAATLHGEEGRLEMYFIANQGASDSSLDYFHLSGLLEASELRVDRTPQHVMSGFGCGLDGSPFARSAQSGATGSASTVSSSTVSSSTVSSSTVQEPALRAAVSRYLELAGEADYDYFLRNGSESNALMASLINAADVIYERDLGMSIETTLLSTRSTSDPYNTTNPETLVTTFRSVTNSNRQLGTADVYHLFTGVDLDGSTIGIAYLGVVCNDPSFSYGLSQDFAASVNYLILAHELGHNLGADHDTSTSPATLMFPSADPSQSSFSARSVGEIESHLGRSPVCLGVPSSATPTPSASPTPGATTAPTAIPSPSATSSGGGGGGGGVGDSPIPVVSLSASISSSGALSATTSLSATGNAACTTVLVGAESRNFRAKVSLGSVAGDSQQALFSGQLSRALGARTNFFLRAEYRCPSTSTSISDAMRVKTPKIRGRSKPYPSVQAYLRALKKVLVAGTPA